ncbi:LysE family translocator [Pararobbsia silviterrae]|uniref:Lysine transporter LysE n=1 Tax=Pararobbsia silviterrae TaxID=1792498 RepID=A0A494X896_9BURK|nr:LysE family transporter [Pararobbsia silviterrae]RKP46680.1 lysine transporter LysE [Pararobbsia silviterrae]
MLFMNAWTIGFCIAAPVGPIGMLCIERSLSDGFERGLATGLGAACADAVYGLLGAVGVAGIVTGFPAVTRVLQIGGGLFLLWLAAAMFRTRARAGISRGATVSVRRAFATTFALTLSNPTTILSFVAMFAALGSSVAASDGGPWRATALMVAGVFTGSACWWLALSGVSAHLGARMPDRWLARVAQVSACVIAAMGCVQVVSGLRHGLA